MLSRGRVPTSPPNEGSLLRREQKQQAQDTGQEEIRKLRADHLFVEHSERYLRPTTRE